MQETCGGESVVLGPSSVVLSYHGLRTDSIRRARRDKRKHLDPAGGPGVARVENHVPKRFRVGYGDKGHNGVAAAHDLQVGGAEELIDRGGVELHVVYFRKRDLLPYRAFPAAQDHDALVGKPVADGDEGEHLAE